MYRSSSKRPQLLRGIYLNLKRDNATRNVCMKERFLFTQGIREVLLNNEKNTQLRFGTKKLNFYGYLI